MKSAVYAPQRVSSELERVIEPLASYICAAERPRAALRVALEALVSEVEHTNRAANARLAALSARRWA